MRELTEAQDENFKIKANAETQATEVRALQDEIEQYIRAKRSMQDLVYTLEAEKEELDKRL